MIRTIKYLMISAVAALALSAAAAQAADFHSEASHTIPTGTHEETVFTANAGKVTCNSFTTNATEANATATTLAHGFAFQECVAFGFINTAIDTGQCQIEASADNGEVGIINCSSTWTVTAFNCWLTIPAQTGLKTVTYTNQGAGKTRTIKVEMNVTGIKYTQHSKSFPGCTNGTFTNGTFTGKGVAKGLNTAGEQVGIWRE